MNTYGNGFLNGDPYSPEGFTTDQAILADTYSLTPTTILDIRAGFMRWFYGRIPGYLGVDLAKTFGFPSYMDTIDAGNGFTNSSTPPYPSVSGYNFIGGGLLYSRDNTYTLTESLVKIIGRHTLKFGGEFRRMDINYFQNKSPGGTYSFSNLFTASNALSPGATGGGFASFLLGYPASGTQQIAPFTAGGMHYQGYYANDAIQLSPKLTVNLGLHGRFQAYTPSGTTDRTLSANLLRPALNGATINGQPVLGAFVLMVARPSGAWLIPEHYHEFAPRVGIAYRLNDKTVIRTGAGIFFAPANELSRRNVNPGCDQLHQQHHGKYDQQRCNSAQHFQQSVSQRFSGCARAQSQLQPSATGGGRRPVPAGKCALPEHVPVEFHVAA